MAAGRAPGVRGVADLSEALGDTPVRGAQPGTVCLQMSAGPSPGLDLASLARRVTLSPARSKSVFYHGNGAAAAARFVQQNPSCTRIDDLLFRTADGRALLAWLLDGRSWSDTREVWWQLSRRLARESSGDVHVFGDGRYAAQDSSAAEPALASSEISAWQSPFHGSEQKFADTVFEKIELPELENNPQVDTIYYNGVDIDAFEQPLRTRPRPR